MTADPLTALVERLDSAEMLDGPAGALGREIRKLIPEGPPKDALSGRWIGHALHPLLTDVPIGTWTSSVILDWTGGTASRSAADRLLVVGLLAAGATVATGWSDWADAEQGDAAVRRVGIVHAATNATASALMLGSCISRMRGARGRGRMLSLAGSAALGLGGWLGGHLTYSLGAGVQPRAAGSGPAPAR
jgi:uncharacterized membrane protein